MSAIPPDRINPIHAYPMHKEVTATHLFEPVPPGQVDPTSITEISDLDTKGGSIDTSVKAFLKPFEIEVIEDTEPSAEKAMLAFGVVALETIGHEASKILTGTLGTIIGGVAGSATLAGVASSSMGRNTASSVFKGIGILLQYPTAFATVPIGMLIGGAIGLFSEDSTLFQGIMNGASGGFEVKEHASMVIFGTAPALVLGGLAALSGLIYGAGDGLIKGALYGASAGYDLPERGLEKTFLSFKENILQEYSITEKERAAILDACIRESIQWEQNRA